VRRLLESAREAGAADDVLWALTALARLKPEDTQVRSQLASELLRRGRASEALTQASFAAWLAPDSCDAYCCLGDALWALGDKQQAAAAYRRALDLDPNSEAAQTALTVALRGL
jgi:Flp pilus assembly protein TadD